MKVLIVSTSADKMGDHATGSWLEEIAAPYNLFSASGTVDIASVKGGPIPIDAGSKGEGFYTDDCKTFEADAAAAKKMSDSIALDTLVASITDYDAIYFAGGHGTCVDFDAASVVSCVEKMYAAGKIVSAVCHGVTAFCHSKKPDGSDLVKGLKVCGFTDDEEKAVGLDGKVPFMLEAKLREQGADFQKGADWSSTVVADGKLISGQNPSSSAAVAKLVLDTAKLREQGADFQKGADWSSTVVKDGKLISGQNPSSSAAVAKLVLDTACKCMS